MNIEITIKSRNSRADAQGIYQDKKTTVKAGGYISKDFAKHIKCGKTAKAYREDIEYVNQDGRIVKDCEFSSPSTAAQFVTGRSTNGYEAWKVEGKVSLGKYLKEQNLR